MDDIDESSEESSLMRRDGREERAPEEASLTELSLPLLCGAFRRPYAADKTPCKLPWFKTSMRRVVGAYGWMRMAAGGGVCVGRREWAVERWRWIQTLRAPKFFLERPKLGPT
jgi:hypothetical protein